MAEDDDSGLPEESQGKLEQSTAVPVTDTGPWLNAGDMWTFENIDSMLEYAEDAMLTAKDNPQIVLVLDNEGADLKLYPDNKNYWVIFRDSGDFNFYNLTEYLLESQDQGEDVSTFEPWDVDGGYIKLSTYQGVPVFVRDPAIDDSRPETQTGATTSATTGTTVTTTTTAKVGAAGVVTTSETIPAEVGLDAFGGAGPTVSAADPLDAFGGAGPTVSGPASAALATGAKTSVDPCLPNNTGSGSGSTPPASEPYPDAILRQARAIAAAPASVTTDPLDAFGGAGPAIRSAVTGGRGNGAAEVARRRADATAPTTVTQSTVTQTESTVNSRTSSNVYIYEPLTPGFDRYDFNSGKKVYTPNSGPSRNTNSQPVVPQPTPRVPPGANRDPRQTGPF